VPGLSRGVKRPGRGVDQPSPSSAEVNPYPANVEKRVSSQ